MADTKRHAPAATLCPPGSAEQLHTLQVAQIFNTEARIANAAMHQCENAERSDRKLHPLRACLPGCGLPIGEVSSHFPKTVLDMDNLSEEALVHLFIDYGLVPPTYDSKNAKKRKLELGAAFHVFIYGRH